MNRFGLNGVAYFVLDARIKCRRIAFGLPACKFHTNVAGTFNSSAGALVKLQKQGAPYRMWERRGECAYEFVAGDQKRTEDAYYAH